MIDPASGLLIPQQRVGIRRVRFQGTGTITYRCHTCGESIVKPYETFFVDDTPGREWASDLAPAVTTVRTTTHHVWHLASQQYED